MARPAIVLAEPAALSEHELLARVFRALSDPNRLRMLELLLEDEELTQSELVDRVGITQSRASEHLSCLVWCGFLTAERSGRSVRYRVADRRALTLVRLARDFVDDNEGALGSCRTLGREGQRGSKPMA